MPGRFSYNGLMSGHVYIAMSGGVDSSIAAYLLKKAGYNVSGIHMELSANLKSEADHADLERTCSVLGIPIYYLSFETQFESRVIDYFCEEYGRGLTPNPCIRCNKTIKFGLLLDRVSEMGGDFLATGHYARVVREDSRYKLLKGIDPDKDQSYFLYALGQKELARVLLPLGGKLKTEVRQLASELGLPTAARRESQDICFIPDKDLQAFIASRVTSHPGDIVDLGGRILGHHKGLAYYTIGQRQGMGVSSKGRLYVIGMEVDTNRLMIGPQSELYKKDLVAHDLNWVSGKAPEAIITISAKVRYSSPPATASLQVREGKAEISFTTPQRAIAAGQSVVFYDGDAVLGGGIIGETI